jgi:hypothetical protein
MKIEMLVLTGSSSAPPINRCPKHQANYRALTPINSGFSLELMITNTAGATIVASN